MADRIGMELTYSLSEGEEHHDSGYVEALSLF